MMLDLDDVAATSPQAQTELAELRARLAEALQMVDKLHGYARKKGHQGYYLDLLAIMGVLAGRTADSAAVQESDSHE